jgi:hypothetical protein
MTSQTLIKENLASESSATALASAPEIPSSVDSRQARILEAMKKQYPPDQQMKFLHLQAETESLLQQLKAIQQQRQTANSTVVHSLGDRVSA